MNNTETSEERLMRELRRQPLTYTIIQDAHNKRDSRLRKLRILLQETQRSHKKWLAEKRNEVTPREYEKYYDEFLATVSSVKEEVNYVEKHNFLESVFLEIGWTIEEIKSLQHDQKKISFLLNGGKLFSPDQEVNNE